MSSATITMTTEKLGEEKVPMQLCVACNKFQASDKTSCDCGHVLREALTLKEENSSRKRRAPYRPNSVNTEWLSTKERAEIRMALRESNQNENTQPNHHQDKNNNNGGEKKHHNVNNKTLHHNASNNTHNNTTSNHGNKPVGRPRKQHGNVGRKKSRSSNNNVNQNHHSGSSYGSDRQEKKRNGDESIPRQNGHNNKRGGQQSQDTDKQNKLRELIELIDNSYQNIYFNRCKSYKKAKLSDLEFEFDFTTFDSHNPFYPSALEDINTKINRTNTFWKSVS